VASCLFVSCKTDSDLCLPFVVTGKEAVKNSNMSNYFENGETFLTCKRFVLSPSDKFQIGDTISTAYFY